MQKKAKNKIKTKKKGNKIQAPSRLKFKKWHKFVVRPLNYSKVGCRLQYGTYGLRLLKSKRLHWKQREAARQKISRPLKKKSRIWIRVFPQIPITQKPKEVRRGKGKGAVSHYLIQAEAGQILFELYKVDPQVVFHVFRQAGKKLPAPSTVIQRKIFLEKRDDSNF